MSRHAHIFSSSFACCDLFSAGDSAMNAAIHNRSHNCKHLSCGAADLWGKGQHAQGSVGVATPTSPLWACWVCVLSIHALALGHYYIVGALSAAAYTACKSLQEHTGAGNRNNCPTTASTLPTSRAADAADRAWHARFQRGAHQLRGGHNARGCTACLPTASMAA